MFCSMWKFSLKDQFIFQLCFSNLILELVCPTKYPWLIIYPNDSSKGNVCQNLENKLTCPINCSSDDLGEYECVQSGTTDEPCRITGRLLVLPIPFSLLYHRGGYYIYHNILQGLASLKMVRRSEGSQDRSMTCPISMLVTRR